MIPVPRLVSLVVAMAWAPAAIAAQEVSSRPAITGMVRSDADGAPVVAADVRLPATNLAARTDSSGAFRFDGLPSGRLRLTVNAPGYRFYEVVVRVPSSGTLRVDIELVVHVQRLAAEGVSASRPAATAEEEHERELFAREILPAATTLSRREMRDLPIIIEPDILRALQSVPGVVAINDFDARLHVRGGGPDQNLFLLDGAPVYGAYHMFGLTGAFNVDAVESVEFLRGLRPAHYGGVLSSVIDIRQRDGEDASGTHSATEGGLSMLGLRFTHRGATADERLRYMVGVRRTHLDWNPWVKIPYSFSDAQTRIAYSPAPGHDVTLSAFTSGDWFDVFEGLPSRWGNTVASLKWSTPQWRGWAPTATLWSSAYSAFMRNGGIDGAVTTHSRLRAQGLRVEAERDGPAGRLRLGVEAERTGTEMVGARGSYFDGDTRVQYTRPIGYAEFDRRLGTFRFAPGVRVVGDAERGGALVEPRLAARWQPLEQLAFSAGWSRDHQVISSLRDERTIVPGPPFYFGHTADMPASRADALTGELALRGSGGWSATLGAFTRRSEGLARWDPIGARDLKSISWDDGRSTGWEVTVRRFGNRLSGWLGYSNTTSTYRDTAGLRYRPLSDRRHAVNATLSARPAKSFSVTAQLIYGSGLPIWASGGNFSAPIYSPYNARPVYFERDIVIWSGTQVRQPAYARLDLAVRKSFEFRRWGLEPYFTAQNVGARANAFMYELANTSSHFGPGGDTTPLKAPNVVLQPYAIPIGVLPSFGFNVHF